ncbi:ABC transporter [Tessaracoccus aquimaris]|uniref:ABC transporter n=1 Tax=Tessaracoccus aquimaris TaxID=1332264 RepID=A0A1Q2CL95_9ACTN|nr:ABC transporter ATP-binding protein [Tessaracoccus aquimaris]AQP46871.1 ABC transporter [Tessaracoccus aquimaris]
MTAISIHGLVKNYGNFRAIDGLDLELRSGQIVGLLGENGCGKTTLLKVLAGALTQYEGEVAIHGHRPGPESKAIVSFLPDASFLPDSATLDACISMYRDFFTDFSEDHARDLIGFFGLESGRKLTTLSKGMREKAQIALAMSRKAKVYLLDEPISGVDPAARDVLLQAIIRDLDPEALILISTHLIHDLEPILDAVAFMRHGKVLLTGEVDDLRSERGLSIDALFREVYR